MELITPRLTVRSFVAGDIAAYARVVGRPEVMRYLGGEPRTPRQARDYVIDCIDRDRLSGVSRYAVVRRSDSVFLGYCGFKALVGDASGNLPPDTAWVDFGWQYGPWAWRQGYGTEAARVVYQFGASTLGLGNIEIRTHEQNVASLIIIDRLGFVWVNDYDSPAGRFRRFREPFEQL